METIIIMAKALAEASKENILRLDIQYNQIDDAYKGRVVIGESVEEISVTFDIYQDGQICKVKDFGR